MDEWFVRLEIFVDRECEEFDPTKLYDSEKYVEKLVKVGRLFLKNSKKEKKDLQKVMQILCCDVGGCYFFLFLAFF